MKIRTLIVHIEKSLSASSGESKQAESKYCRNAAGHNNQRLFNSL